MQKGIELAKEAVEEDNKQNFAQVRLWLRGEEWQAAASAAASASSTRSAGLWRLQLMTVKYQELCAASNALQGLQPSTALAVQYHTTAAVPQTAAVPSAAATAASLPPPPPLLLPPPQALELYTRAMDYFATHLKYDKNPKSREMIQNKARRRRRARCRCCCCSRAAGGSAGCRCCRCSRSAGGIAGFRCCWAQGCGLLLWAAAGCRTAICSRRARMRPAFAQARRLSTPAPRPLDLPAPCAYFFCSSRNTWRGQSI